MISVNPFADLKRECEKVLQEAIKKAYPELATLKITLNPPPDPRFGQLSTSLCFEYAKKTGFSPMEIANKVVAEADPSPYRLIDSV